MVEMVREDLRPSRIMTREAFENAITVDMAIGGSTNAVVHLIAIAGRLGIRLDARRFRRDLAPHALHRQREAVGRVSDGGFLLRRRRAGGDARDSPAPAWGIRTVTGKTIDENVRQAECYNREVIRELNRRCMPRAARSYYAATWRRTAQ